jgi:hypothetical protein
MVSGTRRKVLPGGWAAVVCEANADGERTGKCNTEIGRVAVGKGQRVGLFYSSANHDEAVFDKPFEFNVLRDPNPHRGQGADGFLSRLNDPGSAFATAKAAT